MRLANETPFSAEIYRSQLHYRDLLLATVVAKGSYHVEDDGSVVPVSDPLPVYEGDVETPLGVLEGDVVLTKEGCDLAVYGQALSPALPVAQMDVEVRVGEFARTMRVTGDRVWLPTPNGPRMSDPVPFTAMPLDYTRAFGGVALQAEVDISMPEPQNPLGCGWVVRPEDVAGTHLPNVEEPDQLITSWRQRPLPAGLLPLPRASSLRGLRGVSVDEEKQRTTLGPLAFVWSHPRMHLPLYPAGERVEIRGMTREPMLRFQLPDLRVLVEVTLGSATHRLRLCPDAIGIVPDHRRLWVVARRAFVYQYLPERMRGVRLRNDPGDAPESATTTIAAELAAVAPRIRIAAPDAPERMPIPWQMLRELHPITEILEALPLCASG
jgi:hypothetical protein